MLRLTVESMGEFFQGARRDRSSEESTSEAVRSFAIIEQLRALLTDRRIEVMKSIMADPPERFSALADRLGRNYSDVHSDVELLADHHIVYFLVFSAGMQHRVLLPDRLRGFSQTRR